MNAVEANDLISYVQGLWPNRFAFGSDADRAAVSRGWADVLAEVPLDTAKHAALDINRRNVAHPPTPGQILQSATASVTGLPSEAEVIAELRSVVNVLVTGSIEDRYRVVDAMSVFGRQVMANAGGSAALRVASADWWARDVRIAYRSVVQHFAGLVADDPVAASQLRLGVPTSPQVVAGPVLAGPSPYRQLDRGEGHRERSVPSPSLQERIARLAASSVPPVDGSGSNVVALRPVAEETSNVG